MQIKNLNIVLTFISLAATVLSAPINFNIEASPIPVPANRKINDRIINGGGMQQIRNPFIEASPIPVPANRKINENIFNNRFPNNNEKIIGGQSIAVPSNKKINEKIINDENIHNTGNGNPLIEASYVPVKKNNGKNPFIEASPIPVPGNKKINEKIINWEGFPKKEKNVIEASPIPVPSNEKVDEKIINHKEEGNNEGRVYIEPSPAPLPGYENVKGKYYDAEELEKMRGDVDRVNNIGVLATPPESPVPSVKTIDVEELSINNQLGSDVNIGDLIKASPIPVPINKEKANDLFGNDVNMEDLVKASPIPVKLTEEEKNELLNSLNFKLNN